MAALQRAEQPDNEYLLISQRGVTALLRRLGVVPPELEHLRLRAACGYEPVPTARAVRAILATADPGPVCGPALDDAPVVDFSGADPPPPATQPAIGRYLEDRRVYTSAAFEAELPGRATDAAPRRRHLPGGRRADPRSARRDRARRRVPPRRQGLGRHRRARPRDAGRRSASTRSTATSRRPAPSGLAPGDAIARGDVVGRLGDETENGGWAPHLHLQLLTTDLGRGARRPRRRHARRARRVGVRQPRPEPAARAARRRPRRSRRARRASCARRAARRSPARSASPTPSR